MPVAATSLLAEVLSESEEHLFGGLGTRGHGISLPSSSRVHYPKNGAGAGLGGKRLCQVSISSRDDRFYEIRDLLRREFHKHTCLHREQNDLVPLYVITTRGHELNHITASSEQPMGEEGAHWDAAVLPPHALTLRTSLPCIQWKLGRVVLIFSAACLSEYTIASSEKPMTEEGGRHVDAVAVPPPHALRAASISAARPAEAS